MVTWLVVKSVIGCSLLLFWVSFVVVVVVVVVVVE